MKYIKELDDCKPKNTQAAAPHVACVGERSNFKKIPKHTQDHGDGIATRGESVRPRTLVDRKQKR